MEVFSGEVRLRIPDQFPDQISPFPSSYDSLFAGSESRVSNPEKLRPIRYNGKSAVDYTDTEVSALLNSAELGVVSGEGGLGVGFGEVGFVSKRDERMEGGRGFGDGGVGVGGSEVLEARIGEVEIEGRNHPAYSSASSSESEVSGYLLENGQGSDNSKRRRTRKRLEGFMRKLISKVLVKQEMMHNELMEMMEKKERERLMREEAWKQEEMEWMRREEQVRAQDTARNVALISFIQNIMGKDFPICNPSKDEGEAYHQRDMVYDGTVEKFPTSVKDDSPVSKCLPPRATSLSIDNRRWPKAEVLALIQLRGSLEGNLCRMGSNCSVWDEVSAGLLGMGFNRPAKKCKEKWENINKYFKRIKTSGITKHQKTRTCPYFQELNILHKQGVISLLCDPNDPNCPECSS